MQWQQQRVHLIATTRTHTQQQQQPIRSPAAVEGADAAVAAAEDALAKAHGGGQRPWCVEEVKKGLQVVCVRLYVCVFVCVWCVCVCLYVCV